jgi:hypothetical protein
VDYAQNTHNPRVNSIDIGKMIRPDETSLVRIDLHMISILLYM